MLNPSVQSLFSLYHHPIIESVNFAEVSSQYHTPPNHILELPVLHYHIIIVIHPFGGNYPIVLPDIMY